MEWIEINTKKIPELEVLAANFRKGTFGYTEKLIGYLSFSEDEDFVTCESDHETLENCTHYININQFDIVKYKG